MGGGGRLSKEKGKRGEREFVHFCLQFPWLMELQGKLSRVALRRGAQVRGTPDSPDVEGLPGLHVEVKRRERLNLYEAFEQSLTEKKEGEVPIVVHRKNRKPWLVILSATDFFEIFYRLYLLSNLELNSVMVEEDKKEEPSLANR